MRILVSSWAGERSVTEAVIPASQVSLLDSSRFDQVAVTSSLYSKSHEDVGLIGELSSAGRIPE